MSLPGCPFSKRATFVAKGDYTAMRRRAVA